ncbi:hypothetical protein [Nocardioides fonticola]|uniref:VG15 protein n=1 Tax=Nocardioides fonticola TaxID=450363 RepID=UPI0031D69894
MSLAADYYEAFRADVLPGATPFRAPVVDPPTLADVEARLDDMAAELLASLDAVVDDVYLADVANQIAAEIEGAARSTVADAAFGELLASINDDREAKGWARIARPTACSFCRLLASRGPVYTKDTVDFRAHVPINGRGGTCQCTAEPWIGSSYEPTAQVRADAALYQQIADEGFRGADARNEFRRRIEGRTDGARRPRVSDRARAKSPTQVQGQRLGFEFLTPAQLRHQLAVIEALPDSDYRTKQIARIQSRLLALGDQAPR